jgi:hypothetical protein
LPNQVVIFDFFVKKHQFGKRLDNFWQLGKKQPSGHKYTRVARGWYRCFWVGGRVKKEINNKEGFLIQIFKRWNNINIILFSLMFMM